MKTGIKTGRGAWRRVLMDVLVIAFGSLLYAASVALFSAPNDIAPGGITGLATMANHLWGFPIGLLTMILNLPLFLVAWRRLGKGFLWRTLLGVVLCSVLVDTLQLLPAFRGERILVCLFGGALMGLGLGLIFARGGTTGGSDIVAKLLTQRFPYISMGRLMLLVDGVVILLSAVVYGQAESALYAAVYVFVSTLVTDQIVYGGRRGKMAMVLTSRQEDITRMIMEELDRGVTLLNATGGYTGQEKKMILCAVSREEVYRLKSLVFAVDPRAFFMMLSTDDVVGDGWRDPADKE